MILWFWDEEDDFGSAWEKSDDFEKNGTYFSEKQNLW